MNNLRALLRPNTFDRTPYSAPAPANVTPEVAIFAGGCFWGVQHTFLKHYPPSQNKGILTTAVGFAGVNPNDPSYRDGNSGSRSRAEAVRIEFDPNVVSYAELVEFFYRTHDPTTPNGQGNDHGAEYRSAIFYNSPAQRDTAQRVTEEVQKKHFDPHGTKIATQIAEVGKWSESQEYHQLYLFKNPAGYHCYTHTLHW